MKSFPENQSKLNVNKINSNEIQSKDFKIVPLMYGKKTTKKIDTTYMSAAMADYCAQLFFLS